MRVDKPVSFQRIIVEGNIGAGKSTFLRLLQQTFSAQFVFEPHEEWQNIGGHNLLDNFYTDKERWAYTFQSYAFITRIRADERAQNSPFEFHILERSVYSDRYCFAKNCFEMGVMSPLEWKLYKEWFEWLMDNQSYTPDGFIYLQTDPEICYQRMITRNRSEESTVSLEYIRMIHEKHENWLIKKENVSSYLKDVPVLILECNADFEHNAQEQEKHFSAIKNFFNIPTLSDNKIKNNCITTL